MAKRVSDLHRTAFVTGAASGLGRAFAEMLLAEGVRVWGTSREIGRLSALAAAHPSLFVPVVLDLADAAAAEAAFLRAAAETGGAFDLVINNAGYGIFGGFAATEFSVWQAQLDAMIGATLRLTHAAFRSLAAPNRGCLVAVSSLAAEFPIPYMSGYNVAKAGLSALSESLIFESRGSPIVVIDFRPGDYRTAFNQAMQPPAAVAANARIRRAWRALDAMFQASPLPERAAADLRRALMRNRSGIVRSGSFFQARLAPLAARLFPSSLVRAAIAHYFGRC